MFKTMTGVLNTKSNPTPEEIKEISSFIFAKWLAGSPQTLQTANLINQYPDIPIETQYELVKRLHSGKVKYIKYIKSTNPKITKEDEYIARELRINVNKVSEYKEFMSEEEINRIIETYKDLESKGVQF